MFLGPLNSCLYTLDPHLETLDVNPQVASANFTLRRLVAGAHGPPQAAVGEVRAGPFEAEILELAHIECLHDIQAEEDARRAMGVRGDWWQTDVPATQLKGLIYKACILEEDGCAQERREGRRGR